MSPNFKDSVRTFAELLCKLKDSGRFKEKNRRFGGLKIDLSIDVTLYTPGISTYSPFNAQALEDTYTYT